MDKDYSQALCEAVECLIDAKLENIAYDTTILCTIEDDSRASEGIYTVSYGSAKYEALSMAKYTKGMQVYVQIPQGDWNQQKNIISQKAIDDATPITYIDPFDNFADLTANLITNEQRSYGGLIADDPGSDYFTKSKDVIKIGYLLHKYGRDEKLEKDGYQYLGQIPDSLDYTRLGLSASFKSLLSEFRPIAGIYGLRAKVTFEPKKGGETQEITLELNSEHMVGNPWQLEGFTIQERLFDITKFTDCAKIVKIVLEFYQKLGTFLDYNGFPFDYGYVMGDPPLNPNLFIKDVYIALGYDLETYKEERVKIFTNSPLVYRIVNKPEEDEVEEQAMTFNLLRSAPAPQSDVSISTDEALTYNPTRSEDNHKELDLTWVHRFDTQFRPVTEKQAVNYELTWYRYKLGADLQDIEIGPDWEVLSKQKVTLIDDEGHIRVDYSVKDKDLIEYNNNPARTENRNPSFNKTWLIPDVQKAEEQVKAAIKWNNQTFVSDPLVFKNCGEVINNASKYISSALSIRCEDGSNGNYPLYRKDGAILDNAESNKKREFKLYFSTYDDEKDKILEAKELLEAEYVEWIIPAGNMIKLNQITEEYDEENNTYQSYYWNPSDSFGRKFYLQEDNCYHIDEQGLNTYRTLSYQILSHLNGGGKGNNQIRARIIKGGIQYDAFLDLTFIVAGTTGTDFTFLLDFEREPALSIYKKKQDGEDELQIGKEKIGVIAKLYDYNGNDIIKNYSSSINWSWANNKKVVKIKNEDGKEEEVIEDYFINWPKDKKELNGKKVSLYLDPDKCGEDDINKIFEDNYYILKATVPIVENDITYNLNAYLPIPIRLNYEDDHIQGPIDVRYNSLGYLDEFSYSQVPYKIFESADMVKGSVKWEACCDEDEDVVKIKEKEIPGNAEDGTENEKDKEYYLCPSMFYITNSLSEAPYQVNVLAKINEDNNDQILWSQPIYIYQNKYPSSILDKWDGNGVDIGDNHVLAAKIAAGKKVNVEGQNQFSGVILGDWSSPSSGSESSGVEFQSHTGLYGFREGAATYGFRDDGTAFIGPSDGGRLLFDGEESTIASASYWKENQKGLKLDFDDGIIDVINNNYNINIDSTKQDIISQNELNSLVQCGGNINDFISQYTNIIPPFNIGEKNDYKFKVYWDGTLIAKNGIFNNGTICMVNDKNYNIILDSDSDNPSPFSIGEKDNYKFRVTWDGTLFANSAKFEDPVFTGNQSDGGFGTLTCDIISANQDSLYQHLSSANMYSNRLTVYQKLISEHHLCCFIDNGWVDLGNSESNERDKYVLAIRNTTEGLDKDTNAVYTHNYEFTYEIVGDEYQEKIIPFNLPSYDGWYVYEENNPENKSYDLNWFLESVNRKDEDIIGKIGLVPGASKTNEGLLITQSLGIVASKIGTNIIIEGDKADGSVTHIRIGNQDKKDEIWFSADADRQHGIYARFA